MAVLVLLRFKNMNNANNVIFMAIVLRDQCYRIITGSVFFSGMGAVKRLSRWLPDNHGFQRRPFFGSTPGRWISRLPALRKPVLCKPELRRRRRRSFPTHPPQRRYRPRR